MSTPGKPSLNPHPVPAVRLRGVVRSIREGEVLHTVLAGVDLDLGRGRSAAVVGRSGSGKSTLLHLMAGLDQPDGGVIEVEGIDLLGLSESRRTALRRDRIGFVFQSFHLLPALTVAENVALPLELAGRMDAAGRARVAELLQRVGLAGRADSNPDVLSGGEQQRVAVARALVNQPALLLCDEPTGNLDEAAAAQVMDLLERARSETGCAVLVVTHDAATAARCQQVLRLEAGRLSEVAR
ncbi:MAG: hypothetical protein RL148_1559 [Planctomycetota bacterium]|jgi:putative ABC transport system ATP-binding protein